MKIFLLFLFSFSSTLFSSEDTNSKSITKCSSKGIWSLEKEACQCLEGFTTFPAQSSKQCNYEIRSRTIAQICSFFGGVIGADFFYLGFTRQALFKCISPVIVLLLVVLTQEFKYVQNKNFTYNFIFIPFVLAFFLWVVDLIYVFSDVVIDANGVPLE